MKKNLCNRFTFHAPLLTIILVCLVPYSAYAQNPQLTQCIQELIEQGTQSNEASALCKDRQGDIDLDLPNLPSEPSTELTPIPRFTPLLDGIYSSQGKVSSEVLDFANRFSREQIESVSAWLKDLESRIYSKWVPPKTDFERKTIITFIVKQDGNIENPKISESSGDDLVDGAALKAVQDAAPLAPLPKALIDSVKINFSFSINLR